MITLREHLKWIEAHAPDQETSSRASACLMILDASAEYPGFLYPANANHPKRTHCLTRDPESS